MATEILLPNLGENIDSGDVLSVLVQEGDLVEVDQGLVELETDKATIEVPSPQAGRVIKIHVAEGDTVPIGALIASLEGSEAAAAVPAEPPATAPEPPAAKPPAPAPVAAPIKPVAAEPPSAPAPSPPAAVAEPPASVDTPGDGHSSSAAGPAVRRLARELGVDLRRVHGTGASGRITREDVQAYVRDANQRDAAADSVSSGPTPPGQLAADEFGSVRRERMSRIRQTIARNMLQSYSTIPQLTNFDDADITELEKIRQESKGDYARDGVKLTTLPFLIKAIASSLRKHPVINASLDPESQEIIYKEYVNIGIAVDTDRGLVVPVLRDADRMNIPRIARELSEMATKSRSGDFSLDDLRGGTFTISNLGAIGGTYSTPIINPPEVAILLAGRSRMMPVFVDGQVEGRLMLPLSITYDHRIVDGAAAARFLNDVKDYLSAPGRLLLAP